MGVAPSLIIGIALLIVAGLAATISVSAVVYGVFTFIKRMATEWSPIHLFSRTSNE